MATSTKDKAKVQPKGTPTTVGILTNLSEERVWGLKGIFRVTFDDGVEVRMASRYIKLSWPYWQIKKYYPQVQIPSDMVHAEGTQNDGYHLQLMSRAFQQAMKVPDIDVTDIRYLIFNGVYSLAFNTTVKHLQKYMNTADLDSWTEIIEHPNVQLALTYPDKYPSGLSEGGDDMVEEAYELIEEALEDPALVNNGLVMLLHNKSIKIGNILQALVRGKCSEINSDVFRNPVWEGVVTGLQSISAFAKEACAAKRSVIFNHDLVAPTEYGSRKMQLVCNVIHNQLHHDCGTKQFHRHTFTDTKQDRKTLKNMVGMYFRFADDANKGWRPIEAEDIDQIVDKEIHFRTAMCCSGMNGQAVCPVCYGKLTNSLSPMAAPGHLSIITVVSDETQGVLSTKHLDFLRRVITMLLRDDMAPYFEFHKTQHVQGLKFRKRPPRSRDWSKWHLVIDRDLYAALDIVRTTPNVRELDTQSLIDLDALVLAEVDDDGNTINETKVGVQMGVNGYPSHAFLRYYQSQLDNLIPEENKFHRLPLKDWDISKPILHYYNRSESMAEFAAVWERKIRSDTTTSRDDANLTGRHNKEPNLVSMGGATEQECTRALLDAHRFISRKFGGVAMAHIGMILACSRIESPNNPYPAAGFDSVPATDAVGKRFVAHDTLIGLRSMSLPYIYERQDDYINRIGAYTNRKRPDSRYDEIFVPYMDDDSDLVVPQMFNSSHYESL